MHPHTDQLHVRPTVGRADRDAADPASRPHRDPVRAHACLQSGPAMDGSASGRLWSQRGSPLSPVSSTPSSRAKASRALQQDRFTWEPPSGGGARRAQDTSAALSLPQSEFSRGSALLSAAPGATGRGVRGECPQPAVSVNPSQRGTPPSVPAVGDALMRSYGGNSGTISHQPTNHHQPRPPRPTYIGGSIGKVPSSRNPGGRGPLLCFTR